MQFTKCRTQYPHPQIFQQMLCIFFRVLASFIRISSLSFSSLSRSLAFSFFDLCEVIWYAGHTHILRSPQIYHNNPSISESEYIEAHIHTEREKLKFKDPHKIMASHIWKFAIKIFHVDPSHSNVSSTCLSAFERNKLFKVEILKENYTFKWHLEGREKREAVFADKS
jgi:hypothetical protein